MRDNQAWRFLNDSIGIFAAGAALAGANPMRTGYTSMRLGIIAHLVLFIFVFDPLLLFQGPAHLIFLAFATAAIGTVVIGIAMTGYFVRPVGWLVRIVLGACGIGLLIPRRGNRLQLGRQCRRRNRVPADHPGGVAKPEVSRGYLGAGPSTGRLLLNGSEPFSLAEDTRHASKTRRSRLPGTSSWQGD